MWSAALNLNQMQPLWKGDLQFQTNQNYTRLETVTGPYSETLKTRNQAAGVREVEETVEDSQALEPSNTPPDLTLAVLSCLCRLLTEH